MYLIIYNVYAPSSREVVHDRRSIRRLITPAYNRKSSNSESLSYFKAQFRPGKSERLLRRSQANIKQVLLWVAHRSSGCTVLLVYSADRNLYGQQHPTKLRHRTTIGLRTGVAPVRKLCEHRDQTRDQRADSRGPPVRSRAEAMDVAAHHEICTGFMPTVMLRRLSA